MNIFLLEEQHRMIRDMARDFAKKEVAPKAKEIDENHRFPVEIVQKLAGMGFLGMMVPEEFGGAGLDPLSYAIAM